jgi:hypothetical protein
LRLTPPAGCVVRQMCQPADDALAIDFIEQWVDPTCMVGCAHPLPTASVYDACTDARTLVASGCMHPCMFAPAAERTLTNDLLEICNLGTSLAPVSLMTGCSVMGTTPSTRCVGREAATEHAHGPVRRRARIFVEKSTRRHPTRRQQQRTASGGRGGTRTTGSMPADPTPSEVA